MNGSGEGRSMHPDMHEAGRASEDGPVPEFDSRVARYVDGECDAAERAAFEAELAVDPSLREAVAELSSLRGWFAPERASPAPVPGARFADRVVAAVLADAVRADAERVGSERSVAVPVDGGALADGVALAGDFGGGSVLRLARGVAWAAAALLVACLAAWSGILRIPGHGHLEASTQEIRDAMQDLDLRSAERLDAGPTAGPESVGGREGSGERR